MQATENEKERDGQSWRPSPTGLLAGGAFAPYKRFAAGETSAQAEFTSAEHLDHRRVERANGLRNLKRKTRQMSCLSFWCARRDLNPHVRNGH